MLWSSSLVLDRLYYFYNPNVIQMYMRAGALAAAVRCAAEAGLWELVGRAGGAGGSGAHTLAAAAALEGAGLAPVAATLYHKAG